MPVDMESALPPAPKNKILLYICISTMCVFATGKWKVRIASNKLERQIKHMF